VTLAEYILKLTIV